ncbi:MAG: cell division protein ZapE [Burkholderiaceae bacterium]
MSRVTELAEARLASRGFSLDEGQTPGLHALERCSEEWQHYKSRRGGRLARMLIHPPLPRGVYLWGGVGRGKSFLMDCFYDAVPLERKVRIHFHEFMRATHRELHDLRGTEDPLDEVATRVARRYRLICFDEFHISDIADAMILERLLSALLAARVGFVMTSNYPPSGLYPDGLHRESLLPAIALIEENLEVVELASPADHRRKAQQAAVIEDEDRKERLAGLPGFYQTPTGDLAEAALEDIAHALSDGSAPSQDSTIDLDGRQVNIRMQAGGLIWFDFEHLCGGPRSQNDYLWLAERFHTVVVSNVPQMSAAQSSEARRFTWLVDIFYDAGRRLAVSAAAEPDQLYVQGVLANEFQRTASRLVEMQTLAYLMRPQRETHTRIG